MSADDPGLPSLKTRDSIQMKTAKLSIFLSFLLCVTSAWAQEGVEPQEHRPAISVSARNDHIPGNPQQAGFRIPPAGGNRDGHAGVVDHLGRIINAPPRRILNRGVRPIPPTRFHPRAAGQVGGAGRSANNRFGRPVAGCKVEVVLAC